MNNYLVILSVGPVQGLIAAARKSRDLWSGSALLSELSKACAYSLQQQKGELIFPAVSPNDDTSLLPDSSLSVGNKIQAIISVDNNEQLQAVITKAEEASQQRFINEAESVMRLMAESSIRHDIWQSQVSDYIEVQAAWSLIQNDADYLEAVQRASAALAARKTTRDFLPAALSPYDANLLLPKSSLDGARETVLKEDSQLRGQGRRKLGLSLSEQLDCMGVVKRLGLRKQADNFTAFSRITAHAWIETITQTETGQQLLKRLAEQYESLIKLDLATRSKGNQGIYTAFPYDAQLLYPSRLDAAMHENRHDEACRDALTAFQQAARPLWKQFGEPCRYGVLLLADGDRMGELLDKANSKKTHKKITRALSGFAEQVADIMREFSGHCVYAGGDDVLGFVPLYQAYDCAYELQGIFAECLRDVSNELGAATPTLSVGLAITHHLTPLGSVRELAKQAESHAKGDYIESPEQRRNALGICLDVRSGNVTKLRYRWDDTKARQHFQNWIACYAANELPSRIAYDTRAIGMRCTNIAQDANIQRGIEGAEFKRMLDKARTVNGQPIPPEYRQQLSRRESDIGLSSLADELIVARWMAAKTQQDLGKEG